MSETLLETNSKFQPQFKAIYTFESMKFIVMHFLLLWKCCSWKCLGWTKLHLPCKALIM